jgi:hypothetical protein
MKFLRAVMLRAVLASALLGVSDPAAAQSLTDSVQTGRMTVIAVDYDAGRIVCMDTQGQLRFHEVDRAAVVVTDGGRGTDLRLLKAGDVIRTEARDGRIRGIRVLRHAWSELESPEG